MASSKAPNVAKHRGQPSINGPGFDAGQDYDPMKTPAYVIDQLLKQGVVGVPVRKTAQFWLLYADSTGSAGCTGEYSSLKADHWNKRFIERRGL
jgi:hypothetical protein